MPLKNGMMQKCNLTAYYSMIAMNKWHVTMASTLIHVVSALHVRNTLVRHIYHHSLLATIKFVKLQETKIEICGAAYMYSSLFG